MRCPSCNYDGPWHRHGGRARRVQVCAEVLCFRAPRFRCPGCRITATALPDDVLPGLAHGIDDVAGVSAAYLEGGLSYRQLTAALLGTPRPAIRNDDYAEPPFPSPTPATCFRWIARFAVGARAWWRAAVASLLVRDAYAPLEAPPHLAALARTDAKCAGLQDAWHALAAWRDLAERMDVPRSRWHRLMWHAPSPPADRDRTGWFLAPAVPP